MFKISKQILSRSLVNFNAAPLAAVTKFSTMPLTGDSSELPKKKYLPPTGRVDDKLMASIITPEMTKLSDLFKKYNYEMRIAGGAVRDLVLGKQPHDFDFATTATPDQMKEMFELEGIRMLNKNGEAHGTITARIDDKENFEVTTLRIDVVTDGRRASVEFTRDWYLDAERRDLTMNSMFLSMDGSLYDFFGGQEDLRAGRLRYVNEANRRIQEDYLRILRYFRFYGRFAHSPNDHDEDTLKAISENSACLSRISGERLWTELKQIIRGRFASAMLSKMFETGCFPAMSLPSSPNFSEFDLVVDRSSGLDAHYCTLLAALFNSVEEVDQFHRRMKVSNEEVTILRSLVSRRQQFHLVEIPVALQDFKDFFLMAKSPDKHLLNALLETLKYLGRGEDLEEFRKWKPPRFPVTGHDIKTWGLKGGQFSFVLQKLKTKWKESGYQATKEELTSDELKEELVTKKSE